MAALWSLLFKKPHGVHDNQVSAVLSERSEQIRRASTALDPELIKIGDKYLSFPGYTLRQSIAKGRVSCQAVTHASINRCIHVGLPLGALAQPLFDRALQRARQIDEEIQQGWITEHDIYDKYPLLGIPFSVKDEYKMQGCVATAGLAFKCADVASHDSVLVQILIDKGAIPITRSNLPQLVMSSETDNYVWGRCDNPIDRSRTSGGSSGGEGCLVGSESTVFGLGSDIAGSVRIPALHCGVFGFKPTPERVTTVGFTAVSRTDFEGQNLVKGTAGVLARSTKDIIDVMAAWWDAQSKMWDADHLMPHLPFDSSACPINEAPGSAPSRRLRFGFFTSDHFFEPVSTCKRAVLEAAEALRMQGHEVVPWDPLDVGVPLKKAALAYGALIGADAVADMVETLGTERLHPLYRVIALLAFFPHWLRWIICGLLRLFGYFRVADIVWTTRHRSMQDSWKWNKERNELQYKLVAWMQRDGIDVLLCPGLGTPAWLHTQGDFLEFSTSYTWVWNYFNFPAGVVPVTRVRADECWYDDSHNDLMTFATKRCMRNATGLPVGVHVCAPAHMDELVLFAMHELESALLATIP